MSESEQLRHRLVADMAEQIQLSQPVRDAFLAVPREHFLRRQAARYGLEWIYRDEAIVTRTDASGAATSSSSQPTMMALMLEALHLQPGLRVLEIGAGTGYNAALLGQLVGEAGRVVSVDVDPDTAAEAQDALVEAGAAVEVVAADGRQGWPAGAPYDRIVVTASTGSVYPAWWRQLAADGLLQAPLQLGHGLQPVVTFRREGTELRSTDVRVGSFMALRSPEGATLVAQAPGVGEAGIRISGGALGPLSAEQRRGLARLVAGDPRERRPLPETPFFPLALYLSLTIPSDRFLARWPPFGIGLATEDGVALLVAPDRRRPRIAELRAYGSAAAEADLTGRIAAWEELGRPGERQLRLMVDFADEDAPVLSHSWG